MSSNPEITERDIPQDCIVDLRLVLGGDVDSADDYKIIEDLTSSAIITGIELRRELALKALCGFMGTSVQVFTVTTEKETFAYLGLNGLEDGFFFVNSYPNQKPLLEEQPAEREINALKNWIRE
jgi:hypothetical protein